MWEEYIFLVGATSTNVDLDFTKFRYRAIGTTSGTTYLNKNDFRVIYLGQNAYADIVEGAGLYGEKITQGANSLMGEGDSSRITIERMSLWTPPNLKANINGQLKEYDNGWVNINGELKQIDKMWTRIDNVLREV